ncbi:unnamed protein product [Effrenium voratum]|uniref:Uncharacterized protein n=1 Tax=Effrenium voratum TaxID=2562239 RepID=A0AA36N5B1_9DINO|nr:unnamed protein product [Effrenium voratum]
MVGELAMGHAGSMARSTSAMSMSSRHGSPRLSAKPSQVKWQDQEGDVFALSGT